MNEKVKKLVVTRLKEQPNVPVRELVEQIVRELGISETEGNRQILLMEDDGIVSYLGTSQTAIRLKSQGYQETASMKVRSLKYLKDNWISITIAVTALITALAALFK